MMLTQRVQPTSLIKGDRKIDTTALTRSLVAIRSMSFALPVAKCSLIDVKGLQGVGEWGIISVGDAKNTMPMF